MRGFGDQKNLSYVTFKVHTFAMDFLATIVFTSFFFYTSFGTEINISFELLQSDVNEVIFVNEENIVLLCCVTGESSEYIIRIEHENRDDILIAASNDICLVHKINNVSINDGGEYKCKVSYLTKNGVTENKTKSLYLNVQNGEEPHCFRNGTSGKPYCAGDVLLLSCYCLGNMPCMWIQTVPGTRTASLVDTYDTYSRGNKVISRILIEVGSSNSPTNTRYDCFSGELHQQRCLIGPQNESSADLVVNKNAENTFVDCQDREFLGTSTLMTQEEELPTYLNTIQTSSRTRAPTPTLMSMPDVNEKHDKGVILTVILVAGSVVVVVLVTTFIIVLLFRKCMNNQQEDEIFNRNGSADSYYYTVESKGDVLQTDHVPKPRDSLEANTYMRAIIQM